MIGERENIYTNTNYGTLVMRAYNIDGNNINAFYDASDNLVFVLDNTISAQKPNVLLVINPDGDKKWDEILSADYGVDLETIRPKVDNKYQKLDIEYSGLNVYENLINAYNAGDGLDEYLNDLAILRDSASRHSAMVRLNAANETISKTNVTIVKTKETIVRLETRIKTLKSDLSSTKKEIGKVNTKQSASKILKLESQIEAANEKLKRAKKRLESAQKRLELATVDAELASQLLNQPASEIKQQPKNKPVVVAPEYPVQTISADTDNEYEEETEQDEEVIDQDDNADEVQPLFNQDPQILNEDIAFKPITFDAPVFNEINEQKEEETPILESFVENDTESRPVLESLAPVEPVVEQEPVFIPEPIVEEKTEIVEEKPVLETMQPVPEIEQPVPVVPVAEPAMPVAPVINNFQTPIEAKTETSKPGFVYYILLFVLILLSVFTLWLYQKNISNDSTPVLTAKTIETTEQNQPVKQETVTTVEEDDDVAVFVDEKPAVKEVVVEKVALETKQETKEEEEIDEEPILEPTNETFENETTEFVDEAPVVINAVPGRLNTSLTVEEEENVLPTEEEILARKPIYEPGAKYDNMFVDENDNADSGVEEYTDDEMQYYDEYDNEYYDAEEAAYQAEENGY